MVLLGSTGSIGVNTLEIARRFHLPVEVLVAGNNLELLNRQIEEFRPETVVIADHNRTHEINHSSVYAGEEGIVRAIHESKSVRVINALVGFTGLRPTLEALTCGKNIALANKESLVVAGRFMDMEKIQPIDSEHFGLWYLNQGHKSDIKKLMITASGGAFRDAPLESLEQATLEDVLQHPNWKMGQKITIDSATMVNKMFELLEARWLFDCENVDAVIETKSIIHAMIEFLDGSVTAHFARADMKLPIAFAILEQIEEQLIEPVDFTRLGALEFREIDPVRYPVWKLKEEMMLYPEKGVILNAANEAAIQLFLEKQIPYTGIATTILETFERFAHQSPKNLEDVFGLDCEVRSVVLETV